MRTILQVEDDPNDVFLFQHAMKKVEGPHPIQVACDGQEAIDYLQGAGKFADRERFPFPSLVLLDLKLPHIMGLDVLRWIREQSWESLPVVMLTASAEEADIAAAYGLGANGFLTKPSQAGKLEDIVRSIKHFWLTHNTLPRDFSVGAPKVRNENDVPLPRASFVTKRPTPVKGTRREQWPHDMEIR
jgi:CheY-like chemotaxis protein